MTIHPPNDRLTDAQVIAWAALSADLRGCTCEPEVTIQREGRCGYVTVAHDDHCPVLAGAA